VDTLKGDEQLGRKLTADSSERPDLALGLRMDIVNKAPVTTE
jgi:hypothetical protein